MRLKVKLKSVFKNIKQIRYMPYLHVNYWGPSEYSVMSNSTIVNNVIILYIT